MFGNLSGFDSLYDDFRRLQHEMDEVFGVSPWTGSIRSVARGSFPPINVGRNPEQVDVYLFAAGIDPKALDITIQQNLLTISGKRAESAEKDVNYYRKERFSGDFRRVLTLPEDIDPDQVKAAYENGVLHVTVQRRGAAKPRQIQIN